MARMLRQVAGKSWDFLGIGRERRHPRGGQGEPPSACRHAVIRFGPYELDATQGFSRDGAEVRLTPKSLAVLWLLADRAGRVVSKDDLFETVWADTAVTDSALATCIQEIRHALDDDPRQPRFVETIHRRGYRFVAPTSGRPERRLHVPSRCPLMQTGPLIGRDREVGAVLRVPDAARGGTRQIRLISGEPGVGKTAVLWPVSPPSPGQRRRCGGLT